MRRKCSTKESVTCEDCCQEVWQVRTQGCQHESHWWPIYTGRPKGMNGKDWSLKRVTCKENVRRKSGGREYKKLFSVILQWREQWHGIAGKSSRGRSVCFFFLKKKCCWISVCYNSIRQERKRRYGKVTITGVQSLRGWRDEIQIKRLAFKERRNV